MTLLEKNCNIEIGGLYCLHKRSPSSKCPGAYIPFFSKKTGETIKFISAEEIFLVADKQKFMRWWFSMPSEINEYYMILYTDKIGWINCRSLDQIEAFTDGNYYIKKLA